MAAVIGAKGNGARRRSAVTPPATNGSGTNGSGTNESAAHGDTSSPAWRLEAVESAFLVAVGAGAALVPTVVHGDDLRLSALRVLAVVVMSFVPGWLYVRFSGHRAAAVWEEYVLHLHRLGIDEPSNLPEPIKTSEYHREWTQDCAARAPSGPDATNIYRRKFEAYYGRVLDRETEARPIRSRADALSPTIFATAVIAVGWTAVLSGAHLLSAQGTLADVLRFGFMGAYSFVLQMLVRRFFQSDLRPSAYISAVVRITTVLIVVAVLHQFAIGDLAPGAEATVAFFVGFFPLVGMQAIQRMVTRLLKLSVKSLDIPYPLSDLDGLNIWNEARLLEEGIEDMQNLTTANLVDVMLHTRVPVGRLVDWMDQAFLYLHLEPSPKQRQAETCMGSARDQLRRLGIRAATDLEDAFRPADTVNDQAAGGGVVCGEDERELHEALRWVLNPGSRQGPSATQAILKTFADEPNLDYIRNWKRSWQHPYRGAGPVSRTN